jgi:hypothetical protein
VDRAVDQFRKITERSGLLGLSAYSQDCFATQGRSFSLSDFDHCVAFDHAVASYDGGMPSAYLPQLPRFEPEESIARHSMAGRLFSNDNGWIGTRLAQVQALTAARLQAEADALAGRTAAAAAVAAAATREAAKPKRRYASARATGRARNRLYRKRRLARQVS